MLGSVRGALSNGRPYRDPCRRDPVAADMGADVIVVSNHGGRQLDGAPSSIAALPAILAEVGSKLEVHMDGGIRGGQDELKA